MKPSRILEITEIVEERSKMRSRDSTNVCEQKKTGFTKVDWKGNSAVTSSSSVHVCTVIFFLLLKGGFALDLKDCMQTCINLKGFSIMSQCPNSRACDWVCEAFYMNCTGNTKYHCAMSADTGNYTRVCAPPVICTEGTEPVITKKSGSPVVSCVPCRDKMYYNPAKHLSSDKFSYCKEMKYNKCTDEFHKKDCAKERDQKPWDEQSVSDGFCRCDARNGYAPFNDSSLFKDEYCFTRTGNCQKVNCDVGLELSLHYVCIPKCSDGLNRTELSDECMNISYTLTTLQSSDKFAMILYIVTSAVVSFVGVAIVVKFVEERLYSQVPTVDVEDQRNKQESDANSSIESVVNEGAAHLQDSTTPTSVCRGSVDSISDTDPSYGEIKKTGISTPNDNSKNTTQREKSEVQQIHFYYTYVYGNQIKSKGGKITLSDKDTKGPIKPSDSKIDEGILEQEAVRWNGDNAHRRTSSNKDITKTNNSKASDPQSSRYENNEETNFDSPGV